VLDFIHIYQKNIIIVFYISIYKMGLKWIIISGLDLYLYYTLLVALF